MATEIQYLATVNICLNNDDNNFVFEVTHLGYGAGKFAAEVGGTAEECVSQVVDLYAENDGEQIKAAQTKTEGVE